MEPSHYQPGTGREHIRDHIWEHIWEQIRGTSGSRSGQGVHQGAHKGAHLGAHRGHITSESTSGSTSGVHQGAHLGGHQGAHLGAHQALCACPGPEPTSGCPRHCNAASCVKRLKCSCHSLPSLTTLVPLLPSSSCLFFFLPPCTFVPSICLLGLLPSLLCCPSCFPRVFFLSSFFCLHHCFLAGILSAVVPAAGDEFGRHISPCLWVSSATFVLCPASLPCSQGCVSKAAVFCPSVRPSMTPPAPGCLLQLTFTPAQPGHINQNEPYFDKQGSQQTV